MFVGKGGNEQKFTGDGQTFKGKLIGVLEVKEARGDRMCQDALQELKMAIKASGEHKQRVNIQIAVDGLKIRDEKSGVESFTKTFLKSETTCFTGLSVSSPGAQDQFHSSGHDGQQSIRICVRIT